MSENVKGFVFNFGLDFSPLGQGVPGEWQEVYGQSQNGCGQENVGPLVSATACLS